jgi:proteasome lid subunit RPN8/RPN11
MTKIDVIDLERESLPAERFPAELRAPFRLHMLPAVHRGIESHAKEDDSIEICGVLVGHWGKDENGPFALVTDYIRCDNAASKLAEVTFTHESWSAINREMDTKYADKRIVGWYHSHPDFGIFLSDRDTFIHEHFFNGPGQVAYVVDPVRDLEGVFSWRQGKPTPMSHFWVGDEIHTVEASQRSTASRDGEARGGDMTRMGATRAEPSNAAPSGGLFAESGVFPTAMTLLAWMCLFVLGYGCADWRRGAEQRMLAEGAVAHYGLTKLMKLGLDEELAKVRQALRSIQRDVSKLPKLGEQLSEEEAKKADETQKMAGDSLLLLEKKLEEIQRRYSLSNDEAVMYQRLIALKQQELETMFNGQMPTPAPPATGKAGEPAKKEGSTAQQKPAEKAPAAPADSGSPKNVEPTKSSVSDSASKTTTPEKK